MAKQNGYARNTVGSSIAKTTGNGPMKPGTRITPGSARDLRPEYGRNKPKAKTNPSVGAKYNPGLPVGTNGLNMPRSTQKGR